MNIILYILSSSNPNHRWHSRSRITRISIVRYSLSLIPLHHHQISMCCSHVQVKHFCTLTSRSVHHFYSSRSDHHFSIPTRFNISRSDHHLFVPTRFSFSRSDSHFSTSLPLGLAHSDQSHFSDPTTFNSSRSDHHFLVPTRFRSSRSVSLLQSD